MWQWLPPVAIGTKNHNADTLERLLPLIKSPDELPASVAAERSTWLRKVPDRSGF